MRTISHPIETPRDEFEAMSLSEARKLFTIVMSAALVAIAGFFSQDGVESSKAVLISAATTTHPQDVGEKAEASLRPIQFTISELTPPDSDQIP